MAAPSPSIPGRDDIEARHPQDAGQSVRARRVEEASALQFLPVCGVLDVVGLEWGWRGAGEVRVD